MSSPPMGAKMTPTMKKSGRTVFGVRIGLSQCQPEFVLEFKVSAQTHCHAFRRCCLKAVSVVALVLPSYAHCSLSVQGSSYLVASCSWSSSARHGPGPGCLWSRCCPPALFATLCWVRAKRSGGRAGWWVAAGMYSRWSVRGDEKARRVGASGQGVVPN